jgi:single-stranded DNA-binding protein
MQERANTIGIVGVITETPKLILKAPEWKKEIYETKIRVPRRSGTQDELILQYAGSVAKTKKNLSKIRKDAEVLIGGKVRTQNVFERKPTEPSVKIYVEAEVLAINDPPAEQQNEVTLKGNVCKTRVMRTTRKGVHVVSLMVAVSNGKEKADFLPCICWGNVADVAAVLHKGTYVEIEGRMQSREFKKYIDDMPHLFTAYEVTVAQLGADMSDISTPPSGGGKTKNKEKEKGRKEK